MLVKDILERKKYYDNKLNDIENYVEALKELNVSKKAELYNTAIEEQFAIARKIRSHVTLLERLNNETSLTIGGNELSVGDAVKLRDSLVYQIDTLSSIISDGDLSVINVFSLMGQRDNVFEELILLDRAIEISDCTTEWDPEEED